jgi:hypothetical protein
VTNDEQLEVLKALIAKLPTFELMWPDKLKDRWFAAFERLRQTAFTPFAPSAPAMGLELHVFDDGGDVEIWLDPQGGLQVGVCIGTGETVKAAAEDAIGECCAAIIELQRVRDGGSTSNEQTLIDAAWEKHKAAKPDPIAAAVDAQLDPLKDELKAIGHKLEEQTAASCAHLWVRQPAYDEFTCLECGARISKLDTLEQERKR